MGNDTFKKGLILFIIFNLVFISNSFTQKRDKIKQFTLDFPAFIMELEDFMNTSQKSELKNILKDFKKESQSFSLSEKELIINISNNMLEKKCRSTPHFKSFLETILVIKRYNKTDKFLLQWSSVAKQTITNLNSKKFLIFCSFTNKLLKKGTLRSSKSTEWIVSSKDYVFTFEKNKPSVSFSDKTNVSCLSFGNRMDVFNTRGVYYPLSSRWVGGDGIINWQKRGLSVDSVYAQLSNYNIDTRNNKIVADSSIFYNKYIFKEGILGQVENRLVLGQKNEAYPQFTSYSRDIRIEEIFPNVDYKGGYKISGKDFIADGGDLKASVIFKKEGKEFFVANAKRFSITPDKISSNESSVKIFFDQDSIYHSNIRFKYLNGSRRLELYCKENHSSPSMINTYHKLKMNFEFLEWNIDSDIITFGALPGTARSVVDFESTDMYFESRFESLRGIDKINPLFVINNYVKQSNNDRFTIAEFANSMRLSESQMRSYLFPLVEQGFLFYDSSNDFFVVEPMLYHYIDAYIGKSDYDVIVFRSEVNAGDYVIKGERKLVNAALDLRTKDLNILGVPKIELSSSQAVSIYPQNGKLIMKKNRDMLFNGQVYAGKGRLNLFGSKFYFNYDDFKIDLNKIEAVQLSVPISPIKEDDHGNKILTSVRTLIEAVTGDLIIDHPNNKSGMSKDSFPNFPIFRSFEDSYVFYDDKSIFNGVYNRDNFFFHLQPFEIDSLNDYTGEGLTFPGSFNSAGIFPTFIDTLKLQPDYSLGFKRKTSQKGMPIYSGKGMFTDLIHLSNDGLIGRGDIEYLSAEASSNKILFFPDSSNFHTSSINIEEVTDGIEFPEVSSRETYAHFMPYLDKLQIYEEKDSFNIFNNKAIFNGDLLMQPTGLTGSGTLKLDKAELYSNFFSYNANWFGADTASLSVYEDNGGVAFSATNLRSHIDLNLREGIFYSNGIGSYVDFPTNQYICYIDKLQWDMDNSELTLGDNSSSLSSGSRFISTAKEQDSLTFIAKSASYNLSDYIIHAGGVDEFFIADAIIQPNSGIITVSKKGLLNTLKDATVIVDSVDRYHTFMHSNVDIKSSNVYSANGYYTYEDGMSNQQEIFFDKIILNQDNITTAYSTVKNNNPFHIDSKFHFKGSIELISNDKDLIFDGYFKANHECNLISQEWVKFRSSINPKDIQFTLGEDLYDDSNNLLSSSLILGLDESNFYTTFLSKKENSIDLEVVGASSTLMYDNKNQRYVLGGLDSLSNQYILYDKVCKVEGKGEFDLNLDLGQIDLRSLGFFSHDLLINKTDFNGFLMIDFPFSKEAMDIMAQDIYSAPGDGFFEYDSLFSYNISRLFGGKKGEETLFNLEMDDTYGKKFPKEMNYSLAFTKANFIWDNINKAYISRGEIWLGNIHDTETHALLEGYVIIEKGIKSDVLTVYLETELYDEYYFQYQDGTMLAWSTNPDFIDVIDNISDSKRKNKGKKGERDYSYSTVSNDFNIETFLDMVKNKY